MEIRTWSISAYVPNGNMSDGICHLHVKTQIRLSVADNVIIIYADLVLFGGALSLSLCRGRVNVCWYFVHFNYDMAMYTHGKYTHRHLEHYNQSYAVLFFNNETIGIVEQTLFILWGKMCGNFFDGAESE